MLRKILSTCALASMTIATLVGLSNNAFAQSESTIYSFQGMPDGSVPSAHLIQDAAGNLYGTTAYGGAIGYGTVFEISGKGKLTILHNFAGVTDGAIPVAALLRDSAGNLYGTTEYGGPANAGTVFKIDATGTESILYAFKGNADGANPLTALTRDSAGNLFGTTSVGGITTCTGKLGGHGCGTIFKLDTTGKETVLHAFGAGTDGKNPDGDLVGDSAGNLYGTTYGGGTNGYGSVFKFGKNRTLTILYSFNWGVGTDGALPIGKLVRDSAGNLYGTTRYGGVYQNSSCQGFGCGTIFRIDSSGNETVLYSFAGAPDGFDPRAGLVADTAGNLYGTTVKGGANQNGTVFRLSASGQETVLYSFAGSDGSEPLSSLIQGSGGAFYGTTSQGGAGAAGVVFKIVP